MLTSPHSLLSGFAAVICATSVASQNTPQVSTRDFAEPATTTHETIDVSYRGSGRVDSEPIESEQNEARPNRVAHRGSGRVLPRPL